MGFFDDNAPERLDRRTGYAPTMDTGIPTDSGIGQYGEGGGYTGQSYTVDTPAPTTSEPAATSGPATIWDEASFAARFGRPSTPQELVALENQLSTAGIKVLRNAAGVAGKIQLPNGKIVDVVTGAMSGGQGFQWLPDAGATIGAAATGAANYLDNYAMGTFTGGGKYPLASVMGPGLMQPWTTPFEAPTDVTQQNDPGWQFRMKEGLGALQRSAAAKGTLLTGGAMKDLAAFGQDYASNEYDKVYNRALGEYKDAYGIFNNNQNNAYQRLYNLSSQGLTAAGGAGANNSGYMNAATDTITGMGNVGASGIMGSANAWAGVPTSLVNTWGPLAQWYATRPTTTQPAPNPNVFDGPGYGGWGPDTRS